MSTNKSFFGRLLATIVTLFGSIFHHVLAGAEETWKSLPQDVQDALIHGSGIMALINTMLGSTVDQVRAAIQEQFPDVSEAALEAGLFAIAHAFNLAPKDGDLDDCIAQLQAYLAKQEQQSTVWESIMHTASLTLATILAPNGTMFGALATLIEYVYQTFIKKDKNAAPATT